MPSGKHRDDERSKSYRVKKQEQQEEDGADGDGHNDHQVVHGALHVLELAAPLDEVARRQGHSLVHGSLQLGDIAAEISALHVDADDNAPLGHVAIDLCGPFEHADAGEVFKRNPRAVGG